MRASRSYKRDISKAACCGTNAQVRWGDAITLTRARAGRHRGRSVRELLAEIPRPEPGDAHGVQLWPQRWLPLACPLPEVEDAGGLPRDRFRYRGTGIRTPARSSAPPVIGASPATNEANLLSLTLLPPDKTVSAHIDERLVGSRVPPSRCGGSVVFKLEGLLASKRRQRRSRMEWPSDGEVIADHYGSQHGRLGSADQSHHDRCAPIRGARPIPSLQWVDESTDLARLSRRASPR